MSASRCIGASVTAALLFAGCGGSDTPAPATLTGVVVKGPVLRGEACASQLVRGSPNRSASICAALDSTGIFHLQVPPDSGDYLIEARNVRYLDESNGGTPTDLPGTLSSVVTAPPSGRTAQAPITALTEIALQSLQQKGLTLDAVTHAVEWRRLGVVFGLSAEELSAIPAFDASTQPTNAAAAASASITVFARSSGRSVPDVLAAFGAAMAKLDPDADLLSLNNGLIEAARTTFSAAGLQSRPLRIYGYGGVFGNTVPLDASRTCQMTATGVDSPFFSPGTVEGVRYTICIQSMPADRQCGEVLQRTLDYQWLPTNTGNASLSITLARAVAAFRSDFDRYRYSYSIACEPATTFRSYYLNGQLFPL
jgi:hypothetical protein